MLCPDVVLLPENVLHFCVCCYHENINLRLQNILEYLPCSKTAACPSTMVFSVRCVQKVVQNESFDMQFFMTV